MKKLTTISLIIFAILVTAILTAGLVFYQNRPDGSGSQNLNLGGNSAGQIGEVPGVTPPAGSGSSTGNSASGSQITLNQAEIGKHNTAGSCWLLISGKVYNVTSYLSLHPGGAGTITPYCGRDATSAFATKGGGGAHSSYAYSLLANYYLGDLGQAAPQSQVQQNINSTNQTSAPTGWGQGNESEDD